MNSKQLVLDAINNKETSRAPWVPFVGCHAASLIGKTATEFFGSTENIVTGMVKAFELYKPDGLPIVFDLQLEAEALGCNLVWADDNPPAVNSHPLEDGVKLADLKIPTENDGRFKIVMEAARKLHEKLGDKIALYGLITGPFTLALHLLGTEIFYLMNDEPEEVKDLMRFCTDVAKAVAKMYMDNGADIIAVVDPMTSQISPDSFEEFVTPYAKEIFSFVKENGKLSSFFVCGNAKNNVQKMCECNPNNISIDENIPLDYVRDIAQNKGISFGGNIKLTLSMLFGNPIDNMEDAKSCLAIGGTKGYILSPGCDMPFATPVENVKAITSLVHGEIAEFLDKPGALDGVDYELPDYPNVDKVIIDVVTLDSESCAPCQYMMEAVREAAKPFGDKVVYLEHKVKEKEAVICMVKLGVSNIPTICIDGKIEFVSIIPPVEKLTEVIKGYVNKKGL